MDQPQPKKRPSDESTSSTTTTKKARFNTRTSSHTRGELEALYDLGFQPACNAFWTGRVFPSTGSKDKSQRRLLPPMGISMLGEPPIEWIHPDVVPDSVCLWLGYVTAANATLISREFKEENTIRHMLKNDIDMKLHLKKGETNVDVDATTFFRVGSMRYGSWTLYGHLLQFLASHGYTFDRQDSQRSHVLTFVTSKLPLLMIRHTMDCTTRRDGDGTLQKELCRVIDDSLTMFGLVRDALYGHDGSDCNVPANSDAGKMALSVGRNCGQKLRQLIKHNTTFQTHVLGDIHNDNISYFRALGVTESVVTMELLFNALHIDKRVYDIEEYNTLYEMNNRNNIIKRGMSVVTVNMKNVENMFDYLVECVYGKHGDANDPDVSHRNIAAACCLLSLCYGSRSMGVLACDEITPMRLNLLDDLDETEKGNMGSLISMCTIDNMIAIRSTCKDPSFRSVVNSDDIHIDNATVMPRIVLWEMLYDSYKRVHVSPSMSCDARVMFFKLLEMTRAWMYEYFRLKCDDIKWITYPVCINGHTTHIRMVDKTTRQISDVRRPIDDIYGMMKDMCMTFVPKHTGVPSTGTHVLRRLYVSIAFACYAGNNTTMSAFIRVNLGHRSGDSTHAYDHIRVIGHVSRTDNSTRNGRYISTQVFDATVGGLMATILEMKAHMAQMAVLLSNSDEVFDNRLKWVEERLDTNEADVSNLQHSNYLMHDHVDTLRRLEWRVDDLEGNL